MKLSKRVILKIKKCVGFVVLFSQVFGLLAPLTTFAAPQAVSGGDIQNALETVGTKANRLKTVGSSGVDESSGAFTYSYPFSLPKGLLGLEPSIVLTYNSQSTENSTIGYGWNLALPYIERTSKYGVDKIYTKNDFVSSLGGELILKSNTSNQYLQKIDDGSYQEYTFLNNIFTLKDRSGSIYTYGQTLDSRLCDTTCTKIQKYFLTEVRDIMGNKIKYFYEKKNGFVYPKEIVYTVKKDGTFSNKIVFVREERTDKEISYKSGFRTEMAERIKTISSYTDNVEVAKLELTYTTGQNGTRSLLSNIKESRVGTDNVWTTIPETKFEYERGENLSFAPGNYLSPGYSLIDLNGDGRPEQVNLDANNNGNSYTPGDFDGNYLTDLYFKHQTYECWNGTKSVGKIRMNFDGQLKDFDLNLSDYKNLPTTHFTNYPCSGESSQNFISPQIQDMNGDGFQDVSSPFASSSSPSEYLEDINGDGLADKTDTYASTTKPEINGEYFYLNNGNGWNSFPELSYKIPFTYKIKSSYSKDWDGGFRIVDLNADGLADLIKSWKSTQQSGGQVVFVLNGPAGRGYYQPEIAYPGAQSEIYLNTGKGFVKSTNINLNENYVVNYGGTFYNNYGINPDGTVSFTGANWAGAVNTMQFYDANGDGSVDFGGGLSNFKKQDILKKVVSPLGATSEVVYKGSVNGNNPKLPINILTVSEIKNTEVNKNLVETVKYSYENGKMYFDKNNVYDRRFAGFQKVTTETGTGANVKKTVKYFHQGDGDDAATFERGDSFHNIGRVYKEEVYGGATKFAETYRTYGVYNWDGQIYKYPKLEVSTEFDTNGNTFSKAVTYDYDLASRLPKKTENFGEVKWDITTGTFVDVGEDYVLTKNIYNTKRPQKLLAEESFDINGKFLDKKLYFFDELPFGYVEKGLLSEERNYSSANNYIKSTYTYNQTGTVASKTENNGAITTFTYDSNYNPTTVTNALGQSATSQYNKVLGVVTSSTNPNGKVTNTVYDGFGQVKSVSQTSPKDDAVKIVTTKNISYKGSGMIETENLYNGGVVYKTSTKTYDSFGRLIKSQNTNTENSNQTIDVTYNNLGQMTKVSYPYDGNGIFSGYFGGHDTNYLYDSLGRNISVSSGDLTNYTDYLVNGKVVRDNTPDQHKKEYKYNSLGKLASVKEYTNIANYNETKYEWNLLGNLTRLTDALGNVRNFEYDAEGRLLKQEDLHAAGDNTFGTYTYSYDANGNLISKTDPSLQVATFEYDLLNRPKKESFGVVSNYVYDTCQNGVGSLCEVSNSDYSQKLKYTKAGQIFTETKNIDDHTFVQMYEYDDLGQNTKIVLPDASYISYTYDVNGKQKSASLTRMIDNVASTTQIVTGASYNIDGTIKSYTGGNGVKTCYEYSGTNGGQVLPRLSKINVVNSNDCNTTESGKLLFGQELKYNLFGSIVEEKQIFGANNFNSGTQNEIVNKYEYDVLQRLTKTDRLSNNLNLVSNLSYNSIGNILSSDGVQYSYTGADYQNPHAPSIIGSTQMTYDLNGNILSDDKNQYEWNVKNTLKKVANEKSVSEYTYDVSGERIKEVVKAKSGNSSSTFAMNTGTENYIVEDVFTNFGNLGTTTNSNLFMSKTAYEEIKNVLGVATVTKQDITNLLLPINSTKFISETCASIILSQKETCERDNVLKVVYTKYKKEKGLEISYGTLEEIWLVYKNKLKVDGEVYLPKNLSKALDYSDTQNNIRMFFAQQSYISDYQGQPYCYIYENLNNNYVCNILFNKELIKNYENYSVSSAELLFSSHYNLPASTTKISELKNIDLASTTKFATSSNSNSVFAVANGTVGGYPRFKADITNIVSAWSNSTSSLIGFSVRNQPLNFSGYYGNIVAPYSWHAEDIKMKLMVNYKFNGEIKNYNATTTKVVSNDNVDNYYNSFINNTKAQEIKKVTEIYISESSYLELEKNKLNSQNKVEALFALAIEGNKYVKDTCKLAVNVTDANCQKKEAIKFVAGYLYTKHNIKLSANTLEEMYKVYLGDLKIARSTDVYEKKLIGSILSEKSATTCSISFPLYRNDYVNNNCNMYYYFYEMFNSAKNKFDFDVDKQSAYFEVETSAETGKTFIPFKYTLGTKIVNIDKPGKYKIDFSAEWRSQVKSNTYIWSNYWNLVPAPQFVVNDTSNQNRGTVINKIKVYAGQYEYINKINSNVSATIGDTELNSRVYGSIDTADKNLLGAIYKQKKLASLFGSEKLISRDSFTELLLFGFGYSDLVIKDMLIDVSFSPYTSCENISDETSKRNCRKEKFVKYLFAIVKYEYDRELSAKALDELFEVSEGNLSIPNNVDDYKIRNTQVFTLNSTENTHVLAGYYSYEIDGSGYAQYRTGCQSGFSRPGQLNLDNVCDISFSVPADLAVRKNEIESATITLLGTQGRGDYNTPGVFNPGQVYIYPVVSNNAFSYFNGNIPATALYAWNTNPNTVSSKENIRLGENTEVNVTNIVSGIAKGEIVNFGLRIISTGLNINYTNAGKYQLSVRFAKDADQNDGKYLTPLVTNPKDTTVYEHVLQVLARVDKDYKSQSNDIISKVAWNEIKNTNIKTNSDVKNIFDINEKLQKDDTLAAVYSYVAANQGINLTRETLEELFMVFESRLSMPEDFKQYDFATATTSKILYEKASWEVYSQNVSGTKTDYVCSANTTSKCFLKLPDFSKSYLTVNSAILNLQGSGQYNDIRLNAIVEPLATGTNLSSAKLNSETLLVNTGASQKFDLTKIYTSYANNEYGKNGLVISNNGYSVAGLDLIVNNNHYIEVFTTPNFKVFDRSKLENLSVVPGVYSERSLADDDFIVDVKLISLETRKELESVNIKKKQDIYPYITIIPSFGDANKVSRVEKINYLKNIFDNVKANKNISLSREALEEIYYVLNNKLFFDLTIDPTLQQDNFNRANSSIIGKDWVENYDGGDNLRITDNNLNMVWNNQPWGSFKSVYQNLLQQNDVKISYKWRVAPGATVDGYYPYIGVRSNGGNTYADSYGVGLLYIPQVGRIDAHIFNNGSLIKNVTNLVTSPKTNSNYNVEIIIDKNNFLEFRIWEEGTTKPTSPSASFNNAGSPFIPSSNGNKIILMTNHGSAASHSVNVMMDDFVVSKLTVETSPGLSNNTTVFNRATFPLLTPIENVISVNDIGKTENINYNISTTEIKNISKETVGELALVGVTTKQQIKDIFNLTKTLDKDSRISFFKEYFEIQKQYSFSREALEEIYLVLTGKAVYSTEINTTTLIETKNIPLTQVKSGTSGGACSFVGTTAESGYPNYSCSGDIKITQKEGYRLTKANLTVNGDIQHNYYTYIKTQVKYKDTFEQAERVTDLSKYYDLTKVGEYKLTYVNNSGAINQLNYLTGLNLELIYEPITAVNDRESFGELSQVSTEQKLDASYVEEISSANFNLATTSTSTVWKTSSIALSEFASSSITTVQQIKDLLENASTTNFGKDAKLYFAWKKVKDTKNISLSRLTLEEMWKISLDQQLLQGGTIVSTTQTVTALPTPLPSILHHKMDGVISTNNKKKDELNINNLLVENGNTSTVGRNNLSDTAYQLNNSQRIITYTPTPIKNNPMTFSIWLKTTSTEFDRIVSMDILESTRTFVDLDIYQGKPYFEIGNSGVTNIEGGGTKVINDNKWHKIDLVIQNNPNTTLQVYVDGELDRTLQTSVPYNLVGINNEINLGGFGQGSTTVSPFTGQLDDFKVYNKALTVEEIRKEYQIDTGTIAPTITQTTVTNQNTLEAFNRDRFKELEYISPISQLEYTYKLATGEIVEEKVDDNLKGIVTENTEELLEATLNEEETIPETTNQIIISPETLSLLNPLNYPYTITSPTSLDLQINGTTYDVNLTNYQQFYTDLETNNINTLAKYLNKISNLSEEISYTKYYPSSLYEYDSRGYITINVPFNNKVVATLKYSTNTNNTATDNLTETSYLVNNYLATPVLILDTNASTTNVINSDAWGNIINNQINTNSQTKTSFGLTGHKLSENHDLVYAHARFLNSNSKHWLSNDPMSITGFSSDYFLLNPQFQNSYSYSGNNPVNNVDPDGKRTYVLHGTWAQSENWDPRCDMSGLSQRYENTFGEKPTFISWSGGDNKDARAAAVRTVLEDLKNNPLGKDEQLNFVAHSHGVNVSKQIINSLPEGTMVDNLVSLAGPVRGDYYFDSSKVKNTVHLYSNLDLTQKLAGGYFSFDKSNIYFYSSDIKTGTYGEFGLTPRKMSGSNVQNVNVTVSTAWGVFNGITGLVSGVHSLIWQSDPLWQKEVVPRLKLGNTK